MSLTFGKVDEIFKSYGLASHEIKNGQCTEYSFENKTIHVRQKNVATRVTALNNGGVGGYLYVDHLKEYNNHPNKTKRGHLPIGGMTEAELKNTLEKVIKDYR
ncbi:hypothetical protein GLW20_04115 [Virgibacillus halodenitrificans]|nr:hypothetical protein [Virgibacillus halodenitrificans]